ncbi:hypothetical protein [Rhizobium sp. MHM7A]|uniref:hypothetical protein n=1 Tax=Rhizobium sp. MHM7A TaxID=2583233 RepID=UPI001105BD18|nr:hypothetical protein [Rhizobium sp. MHM7A]TLX17161.1 hypothetical protein FFR93_07580 [Rhizobium sp. MHM7A]
MSDLNPSSATNESSQDEHLVKLTHPEALVLLELLSRWLDPDCELPDVCFQHDSEYKVLLKVLAQLEKQLVEPFMSDYVDRLMRARAEVAG